MVLFCLLKIILNVDFKLFVSVPNPPIETSGSVIILVINILFAN